MKDEWHGEFKQDEDLLEELQKFAEEKEIEEGWFSIIGAVKNSKVAFYDQKEEKYLSMELDEPGEILHCTGNFRMKDGKPFVHAHITLGAKNGSAYGGHLMKAKIFKAQYYIKRFK
ncbi:MAG: PPC domain-containing DNA-binding protein [Candidatus Undinarchaeales archaeon]